MMQIQFFLENVVNIKDKLILKSFQIIPAIDVAKQQKMGVDGCWVLILTRHRFQSHTILTMCYLSNKEVKPQKL